ncbi:hypothetical protein [Bradyrhizobium sp. CCGUVB23]|uniref:hypothetical protein n=1 Tax=Bradyrhizobium sp. CCGUVB23 TaxID=2949630 RepID=UPI0020B26B51|nr:hypothetical protein [Bradyrhizobium sp. CCGUVB23]MCP3460674.1 hypothetical protein [Bradyrhizobium sp. CCGUVB23]
MRDAARQEKAHHQPFKLTTDTRAMITLRLRLSAKRLRNIVRIGSAVGGETEVCFDALKGVVERARHGGQAALPHVQSRFGKRIETTPFRVVCTSRIDISACVFVWTKADDCEQHINRGGWFCTPTIRYAALNHFAIAKSVQKFEHLTTAFSGHANDVGLVEEDETVPSWFLHNRRHRFPPPRG